MPEPYMGILATMSRDCSGSTQEAPPPRPPTVTGTPKGPGKSSSPAGKAIATPCKYWMNGHCFRGERCLYSHDVTSSKPLRRRQVQQRPQPGRDNSSITSRIKPKTSQSRQTHLVVPQRAGRNCAPPGQPSLPTEPLREMRSANKGRQAPQTQTGRGEKIGTWTPEKFTKSGWKALEKPVPLPSYIAQEAFQRRMKQQLESEHHLGHPPSGIELIQLRIVFAHPLVNLAGLDETRRDKGVWITRVEENVIDVHAQSMTSLREALKEINWFVHDTLQEERSTWPMLMVQAPTLATEQSRISLTSSRPQIHDPTIIRTAFALAAQKSACSFAKELLTRNDAILGGTKELEMRVRFGHVRLETNRFSRGRSCSYRELERVLKLHAQRGGARFEARLMTAHRAELLLARLLDPAYGRCCFPETIRETCSITFIADRLELVSDIVAPSSAQPQLASVRLIQREPGHRLNVATACPDRKHDWNIQVGAFVHEEVPAAIDKQVMKIKLGSAGRSGPNDSLKQPSIGPIFLGDFGKKVVETRLKTTAIVPWKATPYLVEVGITTVWSGIDVRAKPRVHWDVQFYGSHWESAINRTRPDLRRKDWGEEMSNVWTGEADSLENRLAAFIEEVVDFQDLLDRLS